MSTHAADNLPENLASVVTNTAGGSGGGSGVSAVDTAVITTSSSVALASVQIIGANPNRKGMLIWNNSTNSAYISYNSVSVAATCTAIIPSFTSWTMPQPCYRGIISAIRNAGTGTLTVTELV